MIGEGGLAIKRISPGYTCIILSPIPNPYHHPYITNTVLFPQAQSTDILNT